jgi:hypothetical protein
VHLQQASDRNSKHFEILALRVPRVSLISAEISVLGFMKLIEGSLQLTTIFLSLKDLFFAVISPTKPKISSLA